MGTVGYTAPEQVRGQAVDARTDLFALGAVLYEMLAGRRAFQRETAAETMTAILREDPPDLSGSRTDLSPALDRIVRHCLEKNPAERFQTARDVAFALQAFSGTSLSAPVAAPPGATSRTQQVRRVLPLVIAASAGARGWRGARSIVPGCVTVDRHVRDEDGGPAVDHERPLRTGRTDDLFHCGCDRQYSAFVRHPAGRHQPRTDRRSSNPPPVGVFKGRVGRYRRRRPACPSAVHGNARPHDDGRRREAMDGKRA